MNLYSCEEFTLQEPKDTTALANSYSLPAPTLTVNGDKDAATKAHLSSWCERHLIDTKYHFRIACGPQASVSIYGVSKAIFSLLNEKWVPYRLSVAR